MPFRRSAAIACGVVNRYQLDREYVRIYPDTYVHRDAKLDSVLRAQAVWCWSDGRGALGGWSAAAMLGVKWIGADVPGVLNLPGHRRPPSGLILYRDELEPEDHTWWRSYDVTTPARTAFDLGRRLALDSAVQVVDAIYQATGLTRVELEKYAATKHGMRGLVQLRQVIDLSDEGAESPWETKTRMAIESSGLPRPETQLVIEDANGRFIARADMGWRRWKVIVEYDGDHHFDYAARNGDIERWNALEAEGWRVIRVKAKQLTNGQPLLMAQIRSVLRERGAAV